MVKSKYGTYTQKILFIVGVYFFSLNAPSLFAADVTLNWDAPTTNVDGTSLADLNGYYVYYGNNSGKYTKTIDVTDETATSYQVTNLTDGKTYYFIITAYDTSGNESDSSNEVSKTAQGTDTTPPNISGVYDDNVSTSSATINWTTDEATDAQIEYGTSSSSLDKTSTLDSTMETVHSQTLSGLSASTKYTYRILSYDSAGNEGVPNKKYTFTTSDTPDTIAPVISNIVVEKIKDSSATITWTTDETSTSQVEYGLTSSYGTLTTVDSKLVTAHSVKITGLSSYTSYSFRVVSEDASGNKALSSNNSFMTSNLSPSIDSFSSDISSGTTSLTVNFTVTASDDDGYIATYEWDFLGDGNYVEDTATPYYVYQSTGTFDAKVRVTDDGGASTVSKKVKITVNSSSSGSSPETLPSVDSISSVIPTSTDMYTVTFTVSVTGNIVLYEWDFDGNGTYDASTTTPTVSHTYSSTDTSMYASTNQYTVRIKVTDADGATAITETSVDLDTVPVEESSDSVASGASSGSGGGGGGGGCFIGVSRYEENSDSSGTLLIRKISTVAAMIMTAMFYVVRNKKAE